VDDLAGQPAGSNKPSVKNSLAWTVPSAKAAFLAGILIYFAIETKSNPALSLRLRQKLPGLWKNFAGKMGKWTSDQHWLARNQSRFHADQCRTGADRH
jgi:hypothetical protein